MPATAEQDAVQSRLRACLKHRGDHRGRHREIFWHDASPVQSLDDQRRICEASRQFKPEEHAFARADADSGKGVVSASKIYYSPVSERDR